MVIGGLRPPSAVQAVDEPRMTYILITARVIGPFSNAGAGKAPAFGAMSGGGLLAIGGYSLLGSGLATFGIASALVVWQPWHNVRPVPGDVEVVQRDVVGDILSPLPVQERL